MLQPSVTERVREELKQRQQRQKCEHDKGAKPLSDLKINKTVRFQINKTWGPAIVIGKHLSPISI